MTLLLDCLLISGRMQRLMVAISILVVFPLGMIAIAFAQAIFEAYLGFTPALTGVIMIIVWVVWSIWHSILFGRCSGRLSGGGPAAYRRAFVWDILPGTIIGFSQMLRPVINGPMLETNSWIPTNTSWLVASLIGVGIMGVGLSIAVFLAAWRSIGTGRVAFAEEFVDPERFVPIRTGPYSRMRHPLFWAGVCLSTSLAVISMEPFSMGLALINVCYGLAYNKLEDQRMKRVFKQRYSMYADEVPRVLPW